MVLNEEQWIKELREKRIAYGISQGRLAVVSGITREYLNKIESGKMKPSKELLETLNKELARFNPEAPLTMLFDYVKIRFPTLDIQHIIKDILKLNINYMLHEDYGHYSYTEHYSLGDIFIYTSADEEKGVLLELKGRGCRQFESYLLAQQRSWYDFLMDALVDGGVMKRIDLAINDHTGILDIPELAEKCRKREYIGKSRSYKFYQSGELIKHREDDREYMGRTLYLGSLKSDVYFCIYEKDYEQYVKLGTTVPCQSRCKRYSYQRFSVCFCRFAWRWKVVLQQSSCVLLCSLWGTSGYLRPKIRCETFLLEKSRHSTSLNQYLMCVGELNTRIVE